MCSKMNSHLRINKNFFKEKYSLEKYPYRKKILQEIGKYEKKQLVMNKKKVSNSFFILHFVVRSKGKNSRKRWKIYGESAVCVF